MRAIVQRVTKGSVTVGKEIVGSVDHGLVVFLGVGRDDTEEDVRYLAEKIVYMRIFEDCDGKLNLSVKDVNGSILAVSQFTLYGDCRKGRRPSFAESAPAEEAERLYNRFVEIIRSSGIRVDTGRFQTMMLVEIHNDGPVTIMLDSKKGF